MELVARLNSDYPPIATIEKELRKLYDQHKIDFVEEIEAQGMDGRDEKGNDPWKGLYNYCRAEYRDVDGQLVPEADAKLKQARIWVWQEVTRRCLHEAGSQHGDSKHKNYRFYRPPHPTTESPHHILRAAGSSPTTMMRTRRISAASSHSIGIIGSPGGLTKRRFHA